ncbi:uncharacterized protein LOC132048938 [Lycium ferocissimum]|uniref:uncharacterized protein LOC132048938 n=1 Tax=Lycium ferocissimum TaxID=112874 RepID=UPI0028155207|nr:uncharacterized protein LOC132048938 [Lycium ferocissimum]
MVDSRREIWGNPYNMNKSMDFLECLTDCGLIEAGFSGSQYTWCNNWGPPRTIWKRLDRLLYHEEWLDMFNSTKVEHLSKTGLDHTPLLVTIEKEKSKPMKYFKFLNIWCHHKEFKEKVGEAWSIPTQGTTIWQLHCKMKSDATKLSSWSKEAFGDIFKDVKEAELQENMMEKKLDETYRQRAKAKWLQDGDKNTSYFHKVIKERRRRLNIHEIQDDEGQTVEGQENIANTTISHFEKQFEYQEIKGNFKILEKVPRRVTDEMNNMLITTPSCQEIRDAIKNIDADSAPGPDGFGAKLYQVCIDIIIIELHGAIKEFFEGVPVQRYISNNWYSIVINGVRYGFFKSNRGLRQGDPLSLALFVISAKLISILLKNLVLDENYTGYYSPKKGTKLTHLAFADDMILFTSGKPSDIRKALKILTVYEDVSGQLINKHKSCVAFSPKASIEVRHRVTHLTGMNKKECPIKYLGCPLFVGRMKISYFSEMVQAITNRIHTWHSKFLSMEGKIILIKHVLLAMPFHLLAAMKPPKGTFEQLERAVARFLWNDKDNVKKHHWSKWENMCFPYAEGGAGFRCIRDMSKACLARQWWNLRTNKSLWRDYMMTKYCSKKNPIIRKVIGSQSQIWREMRENKSAD